MPLRRPAARTLPRLAATFTTVGVCAIATTALAGSPGDDSPRSAVAGANSAPTAFANETEICAQAGLMSPGLVGARCIVLLLDHLRVVQLPTGVEAMLVGAPEVADVNLVSATTAAFSARSVGVTNAVFLDAEGRQVAHYQVVVREPELRRVVLRRGPDKAEHYQCAPRCERTLAQSDTTEAFDSLNQRIQSDNALTGAAVTASDNGQTSVNP
ncbi:MAG: pilus assembly protein N-terminal domain-containing protein [Rhodobacteraceae bacterium]|nr:pilus assembly protein N-terminal domain-containing protein [Paracoccaceae bacterium]